MHRSFVAGIFVYFIIFTFFARSSPVAFYSRIYRCFVIDLFFFTLSSSAAAAAAVTRREHVTVLRMLKWEYWRSHMDILRVSSTRNNVSLYPCGDGIGRNQPISLGLRAGRFIYCYFFLRKIAIVILEKKKRYRGPLGFIFPRPENHHRFASAFDRRDHVILS